MALPTKSDLQTLKYAYAGEPFASVGGTASVTTTGLQYAYQGEPFIALGATGTGGSSAAARQFVIAT